MDKVSLNLINLIIKYTVHIKMFVFIVYFQINALSRPEAASRVQNFATNLFRVISVAMIPIAATVPSVSMS